MLSGSVNGSDPVPVGPEKKRRLRCEVRAVSAVTWALGRSTPNHKCRLYWYLIEFIEWRYSQSCWYFRPLLWTVAPLPSLWPPPLLPPSQSKRTVFTDSVWLWGGGGVLSCVVEHILQEFNTLFLTRFRTYKIATPPQTKTPIKTTPPGVNFNNENECFGLFLPLWVSSTYKTR